MYNFDLMEINEKLICECGWEGLREDLDFEKQRTIISNLDLSVKIEKCPKCERIYYMNDEEWKSTTG